MISGGADYVLILLYHVFSEMQTGNNEIFTKKDNQSFADDDICRSPLDIFRSRAIVFLNKFKMVNA
jgi:hypothetical protein